MSNKSPNPTFLCSEDMQSEEVVMSSNSKTTIENSQSSPMTVKDSIKAIGNLSIKKIAIVFAIVAALVVVFCYDFILVSEECVVCKGSGNGDRLIRGEWSCRYCSRGKTVRSITIWQHLTSDKGEKN